MKRIIGIVLTIAGLCLCAHGLFGVGALFGLSRYHSGYSGDINYSYHRSACRGWDDCFDKMEDAVKNTSELVAKSAKHYVYETQSMLLSQLLFSTLGCLAFSLGLFMFAMGSISSNKKRLQAEIKNSQS